MELNIPMLLFCIKKINRNQLENLDNKKQFDKFDKLFNKFDKLFNKIFNKRY